MHEDLRGGGGRGAGPGCAGGPKPASQWWRGRGIAAVDGARLERSAQWRREAASFPCEVRFFGYMCRARKVEVITACMLFYAILQVVLPPTDVCTAGRKHQRCESGCGGAAHLRVRSGTRHHLDYHHAPPSPEKISPGFAPSALNCCSVQCAPFKFIYLSFSFPFCILPVRAEPDQGE